MAAWSGSAARQLAWLKSNEPTIPVRSIEECRGVVLIVEPREDKNLEFTIRNWMHFMAPKGYGLVVKHSARNRGFVRAILGGSPQAVLSELAQDDLRGQAYSNLMTDPAFWRSIPAENILLVQTDTMCLGGDGFDGIESFDYVGAPWWLSCPKTRYVFKPGQGKYLPSPVTQGWALPELWPKLVGNGGLSFRKKSAMIECCREFKLHSAPQGRMGTVMRGSDGSDRPVDAEDVFFAVACTRLRKKIPGREVASAFACECIVPRSLSAEKPCCFGLHKVYPYHPGGIVDAMVRSSVIEGLLSK